jgi:hypothetical protein
MCASWNRERSDPDFLAMGLESIRVRDAAGNHEGFRMPYEDYVTVIHSSLNFAADIPEDERRRTIALSIRAVANRGVITQAALLREISRQEAVYLRLPLRPFTVATSLSVRPAQGLTRTSIGGATITFSRRLPRRFNQQPLMERASELIHGDLPEDYTSVRASVRARSEHEAVERALDALDLLRGIWNLDINRRLWTRYHSGPRQPVNQVLLGPLHTLHGPGGALASQESLWYEPDYVGPVRPLDLGQILRRLRDFEKAVRVRLSKISYAGELEKAFRRYTRALDGRDFNKAYLELWSVLESLTSTGKSNYDVTIRRALFIWREKELNKQILEHLRNYRNRTVHAGLNSEEIEILVRQLRYYVEHMILFHLFNGQKFADMNRAAEFLDLRPDVAELRRRIRLMRRAINLLR